MITYLEMLLEAKKNTVNYYQDKFEVDYFMELYGVDYYVSIMNLLNKNKIVLEFKNIALFHNYHIELMKECFTFLEQYEKYLKAYLFSNDIIKSLNLLVEKRLKNILNFIYEDEEIRNKLFSKEINLKRIIEFKNKVFDYSLSFSDNKNILLNEFINVLPRRLEINFKSLLNNLKNKYIILNDIVNFESKESSCIKYKV